MKDITVLAKKITLYLSAMVLALVVSYYFGLSPYLQAQTTKSDNIKTKTIQLDAGATPNKVQQATVSDSGAGTVSVPEIPEDASVSSAPEGSQKKTLAPPPKASTQQNISPASGMLFKYTKSYVGELSNPDRDPFRKPIYILELEEKGLTPKKVEVFRIDEKIEAIRRWPLRDYKLVGIIWDVNNPKAMIVDPTNTMHLLKRNYRIGDKDGLISKISEGTITVLQDNIPVVVTISTTGKQ